jgi:hypothetical protein
VTRADFEARAAILEYDGGLSRADAEAQALGELYAERMASEQPGILGELVRAGRYCFNPELAEVIKALGLHNKRAPLWGLGWWVFKESNYRPADPGEHGRSCLVVAAVKDGRLHDLAAMDLANRHTTATRLGVAGVIGFDEIERARMNDRPLFVFSDPLMWLRGGALGVAVVDWARAVEVFDGIPLLLCALSMVDRLERATAACWRPPSIAAIEGRRHAA